VFSGGDECDGWKSGEEELMTPASGFMFVLLLSIFVCVCAPLVSLRALGRRNKHVKIAPAHCGNVVSI